MAKRSTTEDHLALLRTLRTGEASEDGHAALGQILAAPKLHGMVLKLAADLAEKWDAKSLAPALQNAAAGLAHTGDAIKRDRGCEGKEAALRVLVTWEADAADFFLAAARWKQSEPGVEGPVDTAAECRGIAAIGIAQSAAVEPDTLLVLIDLLADPLPATRARAAQALALWRGPETVPLLRLKAHCGDESAEVVGETLVALLRRDPRGQLPFVAGFLENEDSRIVEAAALALGESRHEAALAPLAAAYERHARAPIHTSILMSMALLRTEASLAWLLARLSRARPHEGQSILNALRIYRGDSRALPAIAAAARACGDEMERAFAEMFPA